MCPGKLISDTAVMGGVGGNGCGSGRWALHEPSGRTSVLTLQRSKKRVAEVLREHAVDVEGYRVVCDFQEVGKGSKYLKVQ